MAPAAVVPLLRIAHTSYEAIGPSSHEVATCEARVKQIARIRGASVHSRVQGRTVPVVDVSMIPPTGVTSPVAKRTESTANVAESLATVRQTGADAGRLSALVDLISTLTGRQVKLVPPTAYFVSGPSSGRPPEIELDAPVGLMQQLAAEPGPLEVHIESVLRSGTAPRMLLAPNSAGHVELYSALDLEL